MAGTGAGGFLGKWFIEVNDPMIVKGIDNLDYHTPQALARIWQLPLYPSGQYVRFPNIPDSKHDKKSLTSPKTGILSARFITAEFSRACSSHTR